MINQNLLQITQMTPSELVRIIGEELRKFEARLLTQQNVEVEEKNLYTKEEVMKLLDVSSTTLYLWNKKDILKQKKMGNRVYYTKEVIDAMLTS